MTLEVVYAIHSFDAENDDEINFNVGEPIVVLERDEKYMDGWWQGRNVQGHVGLFPMNYISAEKPAFIPNNSNTSSVYSSPSTTSTTVSRDGLRTEEWGVSQVANWLDSVGLGSVTRNFIEQEITGDILLDLTMDSLKELGISTYGKRYKIMQAINSELIPAPPKRASRGPPSPVDSEVSQRNSLPKADRPISPQSLTSMSRSNTFNTMSSKKSTSSSGTFRSEEPAPLPKKTASLYTASSPRKIDATFSSAPVSNWMTDSNISSTSSGGSCAMPDQPLDVNATRKLSVASVDQQYAQDAFQAPEHEGWLHKQGDKYKTWNKRWFVLKGPHLFYFKSPKDVRMKGIINLRGYRIVVDESIHSGKYSFRAQHDRERTFCFYTDTEESMRKWIQVLIKTTIARDISTPVMSSNPVATVSLDVARRMRPRPPSMLMYKNQQPLQQLQQQMSMVQEEEPETTNARRPDDYIDWINANLPPGEPVEDLATAFRDGERLIDLLENLCQKQVRRPPPSADGTVNDMHMLDTIVAAFKFMGREGVEVDGQFTIKDVFAGDEEKIMNMLDSIKSWSSSL
ncbi:hypothetical protein BJV82DRAFT_584771 [Fennellomyces sp. T-0311]|nr:hypothetical protein BJV82DRAFT_584771 [Fennellomyces sp. T-0311]